MIKRSFAHIEGNIFRESLRKPSNGKKQSKLRYVPAFTLQALQKNTAVLPPQKCPPRKISSSDFRHYYLRGDFPLCIDFDPRGMKINWKIPPHSLNLDVFLPVFFTGLTETEFPYNFIVERGIRDLLAASQRRLLTVLPRLIFPLKKSLIAGKKEIVINALLAIQNIIKADINIGPALVPFYRQLLGPLNIYFNTNVNIGDTIEFDKKKNIGDIVIETLQILEKFGGPYAFINIKYMIPTFQSTVYN